MKNIKRNKFAWLLVLIVILACAILPMGIPSTAYASNIQPNDVLSDLQRDEAFDVGLYPSNSNDYSVNIIQIAECINGNLFIYTYQPCQKSKELTVTKVNISLSENVNGTELYSLRLCSQSGVFCKYEVVGLTVSDRNTRYYNISTVYREKIEDVDKDYVENNTVNGIAYGVGQLWIVRTSADSVIYDMVNVEYVTITSQMIGFRRYFNGFGWDDNRSCDAHFIMFTCKNPIDNLRSAAISFDTQAYKKIANADLVLEEPQSHKVTLDNYQIAHSDKSGWFGEEAEWHRMTTTQAFVNEVNITDKEEKEGFLKYDWILNFYETDFVGGEGIKDIFSGLSDKFIQLLNEGVLVSNVTLLRLEFDYAGEIYNLGVVSNIQTGSGEPTNPQDKFDLFKWLADKTGLPVWAWKLILALIPIIILLPVLSLVFPVVGEVLKWVIKTVVKILVLLIKAVVWIIALPFRGIAALIRKIKDKKDGG